MIAARYVSSVDDQKQAVELLRSCGVDDAECWYASWLLDQIQRKATARQRKTWKPPTHLLISKYDWFAIERLVRRDLGAPRITEDYATDAPTRFLGFCVIRSPDVAKGDPAVVLIEGAEK